MTEDRFYTLIKYALLLILAASFLMHIIMDFSRPGFVGDEYFYNVEITRFQDQGIWNSYAKGISHLFVLLSSALSLLVGSNLLGARLLNILLLPLALLIWFKIIKQIVAHPRIRDLAWLSFAYLLLMAKVGGMFYYGVCDPLMIVLALGALFFIVSYLKDGAFLNLVLAAILSGMMLWVRQFSILILGGVFAWIALTALIRKFQARYLLQASSFILIFLVVAMVVQVPSLVEHKKMSFERKSLSGDWGARNWLMGVMRLPKGSVFSYARPEWQQVENYISQHGTGSIPKGFLGRVKRDPKFMLDNFASNIVIRFPYILLVSIGLLMIPLLDYLRKPELWFSSENQMLLPFTMVFFSVGLGVSMVIISYVEHRWQLMAVGSSLALASAQLERYNGTRLFKFVTYAQLAFLLGMGILSTISKVM